MIVGQTAGAADQALLDLILQIADGTEKKAEEMGAREIVILKNGVTL